MSTESLNISRSESVSELSAEIHNNPTPLRPRTSGLGMYQRFLLS